MALAPFDISTLITSKSDVQGGRPCLAGTRITVHSIAAASVEGLSVDEMVERTHVDAAHVHAALAYYFANQAAIDADLAADNALYSELASKHRSGIRGREF